MNSKTSYFSISPTLIRENNRRFWAIPVIGTVFYLLVIILPILISYADIDNLASYIELTLNGANPFSVALNGLVPLVAAVMVFKYIHESSATTMMHAMPFTRGRLFNSNYLSGLLFSWIPVLVNGIILLILSKPAKYIVKVAYSTVGDAGVQGASGDTAIHESLNVFSRMGVLEWIGESLLVITFVYAIVVFAAMITGNLVMNFMAGAGFNFLVPGVILVALVYWSEFLFGFDSENTFLTNIIVNSTPLIKVVARNIGFGEGTELGVFYIVGSIAVMVVIYIISRILYDKRALEKASETLVFPILDYFVCVVLTFLGVAFGGLYFQLFVGGNGLWIGFVLGGGIMFILARMVVKKSVRIFNGDSLKSLGICTLVCAIFVATMVFDVTGYEDRIPSADKVTSVRVDIDQTTGNLFSGWIDTIVGSGYEDENIFPERNFNFKTKENIENVIGLQKSIVSSNDQNKLGAWPVKSHMMTIDYDKGEKHQSRKYYNIDHKLFETSTEMKEIYESTEYKDMFSIKNIGAKDIIVINMAGNRIHYDEKRQIYEPANIIIDNQDDIKELVECYEKDFRGRTFEEAVSLKEAYARFYMEYTVKKGGKISTAAIRCSIGKDFENTIAWLEEKGYAEALRETSENIELIEMTKYIEEPHTNGNGSMITCEETIDIRAKDKIQKIIDGADREPQSETYYEISVRVKPRGEYQLPDAAKAFIASPKVLNVDYMEHYVIGEQGNMQVKYVVYLNEGNPLIEELLKK